MLCFVSGKGFIMRIVIVLGVVLRKACCRTRVLALSDRRVPRSSREETWALASTQARTANSSLKDSKLTAQVYL